MWQREEGALVCVMYKLRCYYT